MGDWILAILLMAAIYLIPYGVYLLISNIIEKRKENIKNIVIKEFLDKNPNIKKKIKKYKKKLKEVGYTKKEPTTYDYYYKYQAERQRKKIYDRCPECNKGYLVARKGTYGKFIGCSRFPECKFTTSIKKYKKNLEEEFIEKLNRAYELL